MKKLVLILLILLDCWLIKAQKDMPYDSLFHQFEEIERIWDKDNGKLWGKNLHSPILVIDKISKKIVANQQDLNGQLKPKGKVYIGQYPENSIVACTATEFEGKSWIMVSYPFDSSDSFNIYSTYIHESFHRIQSDLEFNCRQYNNSHMDQMQARIFLSLEWLALLKAIETTGKEHHLAIKDALLFRQYRRQLFPGADTMENRFELHEGLAEYTAFKLCCKSKLEFKEKILQRKSRFLNNEGSCIRTFGYLSGLLYGYLLDETGNSWRQTINCEGDLGFSLQKILKIDLSIDTANWFNQSKARYPYEEICNHENEINHKKDEIISKYRMRFTQRPMLRLDLIDAVLGIYSSPHSLDTIGSVFPIIDISDKWGYLKVIDKGCLLTYKKAFVTADKINIEGKIISGDGWNLKLNDNWAVEKQDDNFIIKELKPIILKPLFN